MRTIKVPSPELRLGQSVVFLGSAHRIVRLTPAKHPSLGPYTLAVDATGWGISIFPGGTVEVLDERPANDAGPVPPPTSRPDSAGLWADSGDGAVTSTKAPGDGGASRRRSGPPLPAAVTRLA